MLELYDWTHCLLLIGPGLTLLGPFSGDLDFFFFFLVWRCQLVLVNAKMEGHAVSGGVMSRS